MNDDIAALRSLAGYMRRYMRRATYWQPWAPELLERVAGVLEIHAGEPLTDGSLAARLDAVERRMDEIEKRTPHGLQWEGNRAVR